MWTSAVCGACRAQGGQPPTLMPAGHRQRPARRERCGETEHALAALLLCDHCFHTHHQGAMTSSVIDNFLTFISLWQYKTADFDMFSFKCPATLQPFPLFVLAPNSWPQQHPWLCQLSHSWEWEAPLHHEAGGGQPRGRRSLLHSLPRIFRRTGTYSQRKTYQ